MILSVKCLNNLFIIFILLLSLVSNGAYIKKELDLSGRPQDTSKNDNIYPAQIIIPDQSQYLKDLQTQKDNAILHETQALKEEVIKLKKELIEQKDLTSMLVDRTIEVIDNQNQLLIQFKNTSDVINDISSTTDLLKQQLSVKETFILNMSGKPFAFIDNGFKLYEYNGGNLIGWINPKTNEIIRNFDNSTVAVVENDFVIDATGHPIGSIERSENLRWDREKLYPKVQKNPISHFFVRPSAPTQFILTPYRSSDWSAQNIEDILFFAENKIQKLK